MDWTVAADLTEDGVFHFVLPKDDTSVQPPSISEVAPVEIFLVSVAQCFAKSCHIVLDARGETTCSVVLKVDGKKAPDKPNRVGRIVIGCSLDGLAPDHAQRVMNDAKRICTVTNSLNCEIEVNDSNA